MLNNIFVISLLLPRKLKYYTVCNVKYPFQKPDSIASPSSLYSLIFNFPVHYNIILNIYDACAFSQINVDQEECLFFSC